MADNLGFCELLLMGLLLNSLRSRGHAADATIALTVALLILAAALVLAGQALFSGQGPLALLSRKAADTARRRHEFRLLRQERDKRERAARLASRSPVRAGKAESGEAAQNVPQTVSAEEE